MLRLLEGSPKLALSILVDLKNVGQSTWLAVAAKHCYHLVNISNSLDQV